MSKSMSFLVAGLAASGLALGSAAAGAQAGQATPPTNPPAGQAQTQFDQERLESYAVASADLREISRKWEGRMVEAEDPQKVQEMQVEAEAEMVDAVEAQGLTAEEFNEVTRAAQANPALAQQLAEMIAEVEQGG